MPQRSHRYNKSGPLLRGSIVPYRLDMQAEVFKPKEARAEYARLRREANRRLEVLRRSEFANLPSVSNRPTDYAALPRNASEQDVRRQLYEVARFLNLKTSSAQGARKARREFVRTMKDAGYTWINESNADAFGRFMGAVQKHHEAKGYDSDQIAELFHTAQKKHIDTKTLAADFQFWIDHEDQLEKAPRSQSTVSSSVFAEKIGLEDAYRSSKL